MSLSKKGPVRQKDGEEYHHGDLRAALLDAALALLKKKAPEDISLRELARSAGVSQAAPYRHFKDKDDLLAELAKQGFDIISRDMQETIERCRDDALEMFYQCSIAYVRMALDHPQHFKLMFGSGVRAFEKYPPALEAATRTLALMRDMVVFCQRRKVLGDGDPLERAFHCWSIVHGFATLYAADRLKYLGVTAQNAEKALRTLLSQFLVGAGKSLQRSDFGFAMFDTRDSQMYKQKVAGLPITTDGF